jgi:hydrogenase maturation protein HypF
MRLALRGAVQGVGFRPFVYRLAAELGLAGWVNNSPQGVFIEVEGACAELQKFLIRLETDRPPRSSIQSLEASWLDPIGYKGFEIRESDTCGEKTTLVLPDIATCPDCLREIFDPSNRRYRYPFTNCTNCGPRFSIIEALPYDRANTSMKSFKMCPACQAEYDNPRDRRFHAQPNACPVCGPRLRFWDETGIALVSDQEGLCAQAEQGDGDRRDACPTNLVALLAAAEAIRKGQIVAVKGIGGFHLMVDARNDVAVRRLRARKHREEKPLALMFPTLDCAKAVCEISALEERLLRSSESPIVLLRGLSTPSFQLAASIAPGNPNLGVMLPYTPLHHLLMTELGFPIVATSGNLSDEPICTDEREAFDRLGNIADAFLVHNRPIVRHVDDSIVRVMMDREMVLRRARGYAPLPIQIRSAECGVRNILAVGAHLKNSVALAVGPQVFISQHLGDLETEQAHAAFRRVIADFQTLFDVKPEIIAADLHPDYLSTKYAQSVAHPIPPSDSGGISVAGSNSAQESTAHLQARSLRHVGVQHHIAHVHSCMAENELEPPALGVAWDGTGYGLDGTIWGGEFFLVSRDKVERVAHLRPFRLPGGDAAVKEPRRAALGLLHALVERRDDRLSHLQQKFAGVFSEAELAALRAMLERGVNSPLCSSVGRLFDAVASLVGLRQQVRFEGQAAMELEFAQEGVETVEAYPIPMGNGELQREEAGRAKSEIVLDWSPMIEAIIADAERGDSAGMISAKFHNALVEAIVTVAKSLGESRVVLCGGCFQNRYLTEQTVARLRAEGFQPYWHQRVPPNDGGIALGQIVAARRTVG